MRSEEHLHPVVRERREKERESRIQVARDTLRGVEDEFGRSSEQYGDALVDLALCLQRESAFEAAEPLIHEALLIEIENGREITDFLWRFAHDGSRQDEMMQVLLQGRAVVIPYLGQIVGIYYGDTVRHPALVRRHSQHFKNFLRQCDPIVAQAVVIHLIKQMGKQKKRPTLVNSQPPGDRGAVSSTLQRSSSTGFPSSPVK